MTDWLERFRLAHQKRQRINAIRKPPCDAVFKSHFPREPGKCDWCGERHDERTPVRKQLRLRHQRCEAELQMIQSAQIARDWVFDRDKGICAGCGEDWSLMSKFVPEWRNEDGTPGLSRVGSLRDDGRYDYVMLKVISLWHVDHRVPLWKVAHMPDLERIEYWKIGNLQTLCEVCHTFKTSAEAAEKAKYDARERPAKPKRKWPSRKLPSRPMRGPA